MNRIRNLLVAFACLLCVGAQAQWQWIDKDGRKVFSDRAPPPDVPIRNIVKKPANAARSVGALPLAPDATAGASGRVSEEPGEQVAVPKLSSVDKELADKKKQADADAAVKIKAEEERVAKARSENCERAKTGKALVESGVRLSLTNAKGEREYLDDAARAGELKRIQIMMDANCK